MKIIDILKKCSYNKIEEKISLHYGKKELKEYKKLYEYLSGLMSYSVSESSTYVYITAYSKDDYGTPIENFSEDETMLAFDVSAYEKGIDTVYSIAASSYSEFLQYNIDPWTLSKFSYESIIAHCFYEITAYGFKDIIYSKLHGDI